MKNEIAANSVKEIFRKVDARKSEEECAKMKHKSAVNFVDVKSRNDFAAKKVTVSLIKCVFRYNYCIVRNTLIRNNIVGSKYLMCSKIKIWDYAIKCIETRCLR